MKKFTTIAAILLSSIFCISIANARPIKAVLIVQNHAGDEFSRPLSNIGSRLRAKLAGQLFAVVEPNDRVGTEQNRGPNGERLPSSSAINLALSNEGEMLITASIDEAFIDTIGVQGPRQRKFAQMTMTIAAIQLPLGESVIAETYTVKSDSVATTMVTERADAIYSQAVRRLIDGATTQFLTACKNSEAWKTISIPEYIDVGFGCNLPGANIILDGFSRGTAGSIGTPVLKVRTWRGIHHIRIESDFMRPFETEAFLENGTSFLTVLRESEEGRKIRKEDKHFDLLMERIEKSGTVDDKVRLLRASGYSKYLQSSFTRIKGMPQVLSMRDCEMPDFGLNPDKKGDGVNTTTKDLLNQAGSTLGLDNPSTTSTPQSQEVEDEEDGDVDRAEEKINRTPKKEDKPERERHDNTDIGVAIPLDQQQSHDNGYTPVQQQPVQPVQTPPQQPQQPVDTQAQPSSPSLIDGLEAVKTGVDTGKSIIEGIEAIGNILQ